MADIVQVLDDRLHQVRKDLTGARVAVDPGQFGRFNDQLGDMLNGLDVVGLFEPEGASRRICNQGYTVYQDWRTLLSRSDVILRLQSTVLYDRRELTSDMIRAVRSPFPVIDLLAGDDANGWIRPEEDYLLVDIFQQMDGDSPRGIQGSQLWDDFFHQHRLQNDGARNWGLDLDLDEEGDDQPYKPYRHFARNLFAYQKAILATGHLFSRCPVCGEISKSVRCYPVFNSMDSYWLTHFFEFRCADAVFYLMTGATPCLLLGVYLPEMEMIISFIAPEYDRTNPAWQPEGLIERVNDFKRFCLYRWPIVKNANPDRRPQTEQGPVLAIGFIGVFGHTLHDELGALEYILKTHGPEALPEAVLGPHDPFDVQKIFPDLHIRAKFQSSSPQRASMDLFARCLEKHQFCFRLSHVGRVQASLCRKVFSVAKRKCSRSFVAEVDQSRRGFPLVWITLRAKNRVWRDMVHQIGCLIRRMTADYPMAGFVLDGLPDSGDHARAIKSQAPVPDQVYDATDLRLHETIYWIQVVDYTIQARGNATALAVIANKTGICYGARTLLPPKATFHKRVDFLGCYSGREKGVPIVILPVETARKDPNPDSSPAYDNYEDLNLHWRDLWAQVEPFNRALTKAVRKADRISIRSKGRTLNRGAIETVSTFDLEPEKYNWEHCGYRFIWPDFGRVSLPAHFQWPWKQGEIWEINARTLNLDSRSLRVCMREWSRILRPGSGLTFTFLSLERFMNFLCSISSQHRRERIYGAFMERSAHGLLPEHLVRGLLKDTGFQDILLNPGARSRIAVNASAVRSE